MRITGEWYRCDDAVLRPVVVARVSGIDGRVFMERLLIDTGADRTVFTADLLRRLQLPTRPPPADLSLVGVGGAGAFVLVTTALVFQSDESRAVRVQGGYAAFTDPEATDMCVLRRDVLDNFDVILGRRQGDILFLAPNHQYRVVQA